jgi:spectinomycin phosphotransferase
LWGKLDSYKAILYPFVEGQNGYEVTLSKAHWRELGTALKKIHATKLPAKIMENIRRETYAPQARDIVKKFLTRPKNEAAADPIALEMAAFLRQHKLQILDLIARAEQLAQKLQIQPPELAVCHSDLHAGNIFISSEGACYIIDWDEPILAPKERDLMYIGGGLLASGLKPRQEEKRFYKTYGKVPIDANALAYYRYERIIQDIAVYCQQLLLSDEGGADRAQSLHYLKSNFLPKRTIEIAYKSDKTISTRSQIS